MLENKIFVYGTLMNSFSNFNKYLNGTVTSVKPAYIYGNLYHLICHDCPGVIDGKDRVYGQVISFMDDEKIHYLISLMNLKSILPETVRLCTKEYL